MIRTIYVYLYRLNGEPIYVGQSSDVNKRDRVHVKERKSSFEKFLAQVGRDKFSLEIVGQVEDIVWHGPKANALENEMMDRYNTRRPGHFGFNQVYANGEMSAQIEAARVARMRSLEVRNKISNSLKGISCPQRGHVISKEQRKATSERMKRTGSPWNKGRAPSSLQRKSTSKLFKGKEKSILQKLRMSTTHLLRGTRPSIESAKKGGHVAGLKNSHQRWHICRGIWNPSCKLCFEVI